MLEPTDKYHLSRLANAYIEHLRVTHYTEQTVDNQVHHLSMFIRWCEERSLYKANEITRPILERYRRYLFYYRRENGKPLSVWSQHNRLSVIRSYFKWLTIQNYLLSNPASELPLPRTGRSLPKSVLNAKEAEQVLMQADITTPLGLRDRAILEVFYSTGLRRMECANLELFDVDRVRGTIFIRQGKGKKDRFIPIGERALKWLDKYLDEARQELVVEPDPLHVFLSDQGTPMCLDQLTNRVKRYVDEANIGKTGACHLFRHSMATLMLENGADIRYIQQMLGHADLKTTSIYTHISIIKLKEIHTATHPARLEKQPSANHDSDGAMPTAADVMTVLAVEQQEENETSE